MNDDSKHNQQEKAEQGQSPVLVCKVPISADADQQETSG